MILIIFFGVSRNIEFLSVDQFPKRLLIETANFMNFEAQ